MWTQVCKDFFKTYFYNNRTLSLFWIRRLSWINHSRFCPTRLPCRVRKPRLSMCRRRRRASRNHTERSLTGTTSWNHWHDELECLTILDGTLDFQLNESVISLQKGSTLIVLPGAIHRNLPKPEDTVFMRILANPALLTANEEIREKLVRPLLQNASREYFYIPAGSDDAPKVQRLLRELQASKDSKEPAAPFRTVALIHMLLYYLYRSFPPMLNALPQPSFSDRAVQKDMVHFIYEHYQEKITLADISAAGKVSRSKCCSLFKIYMGSSPIDFVNDYRLEVSRSLLQYTDTSVADIAFNCGFTSQSYFTKLFSRTFHMTPTEFRNSTKKISI